LSRHAANDGCQVAEGGPVIDAQQEPVHDNRDRWDALSAIVLALAAVLSAWAAYQSTLWSGDQAQAYAESAAARAQAARHASAASRQIQIDVATFLEWSAAKSAGNAQQASFLEARFRSEFQPAFQAWLATATTAGVVPPGTPFDRPEYQLAEQKAADDADAQAEQLMEEADRDNQVSDNFVLTAVIFASVLFVAGIASRFEQPRIKGGLAAVAAFLFVVGAIFEFVLPQSFGL